MEKNSFFTIEKIVVNVGYGKQLTSGNLNEKTVPELAKELALITGQKPQDRPARKSIAGFKIREGQNIAFKVTLRGKRMSDFLRRVVWIAIPRIRDFRGIPLKSVDQQGNLHIGIRDQFVFPELTPDTSKVNFGMQVTIVPKQHLLGSREKAVEFYRSLGIPLKKA
ncbi:MAG: 50S ribosomal protein L5 [Candidatus Harrisonbacteria bacterium CG10_big_fil_rev_8_21_14_0_10_42_17]|uniref:50S ribosomal protein L5 n=1 Tax=Candidatus Harrisonbacteria bacterium CG10_big_fil_rev_8_21_14_0_10_42_17 TaxID=1974584 RepID=A0A2M6WHL7_9BACT|nr:MAG: 50S ribosomal protein L5 [Candidatus Harrisonbacteria bacterium CG10_big_fil_rev_8_21_14_0_10_42_17]